MPKGNKNYIIGRGRLFFEMFKPGSKQGTGERYFGNTPELSTTSEPERLDHYDADQGLREKDESFLLEIARTGAFNVDNINAENLAMWFLGQTEDYTQTQTTGALSVFPEARTGVHYQLGATATSPSGAREITNVVVGVAAAGVSVSEGDGDISTIVGVTVVPALGNWEADLALGRVYIEPDSLAIPEDGQIIFQFDIEAQERLTVVSKDLEIRGALRFIADNRTAKSGLQNDYYWPHVTLSPTGDFALKGDDWQNLGFSFEIMRKDAKTPAVIIDRRA